MRLNPITVVAGLAISVTALPVEPVRGPNGITSIEAREDLPGLSGSTENGIKENDGCHPLTLIFARGTAELGNMGSIIGPSLAQELRNLLDGKITIQGVKYPASVLGNLVFGAVGAPTMIDLIHQSLSQCPHSKVVLAGYSQGASLIHVATRSLEDGQVTAAVLFGDPLVDTPLESIDEDKVKSICRKGDPVCQNGLNFGAHLTYGETAAEAAAFLVQAASKKY
ncbi:hypothetical protein FQN50_002645 [Emmonsiellopsis sp. PD_5]|nr:hypothetical protein FQN50_002645 [Emmonsiellopsis sp. PD_5]